MRIKDKKTYLDRVAQIESNNNPNAKAKTSSATGLYQFTDSTWKSVVDKYNLGYSLEDRKNPEKATKVMELFTADNERMLKPILGRPLTDSEKYISHFLGAGGAKNVFSALKQDENMPVSYYISPKALQANKSVFYNKDGSVKTTRQFLNWADTKVNGEITFKNNVEPYMNQERQVFKNPEVTTQLSSVPDVYVEEKETPAKELEQKSAEKDFTEEYIQLAKERPQQEQQQVVEEQPRITTDVLGIYNQVNQMLAQEGAQVKYGTPEYEQAYNRGEVITKDGVRSPILLDEVVIQNNYKRPRGFWEQYRDKIVEENKDSGVLGAIIGTPISAITSLPQMAATYAFTGKAERPSEAMDIENPYGAIAMDMIADPANLIGAGLLTKEKALSRLVASKESGLLSKAYKLNPLEVPKSNFKSEIDWAKWNKEIPENKALMQEYNAIEQQAKINGSWMKNPDGSAFNGTPEQFVQQNSSNFKKAFGNSKLVNLDGSPTIQYHGSAKKFDTFDESKFQLGDAGYSGQGIYTTPDKGKASSYALSSKSIHKGEYNPTVYELYGQGNNPISAEDLIKQGKNYDLFNFHREKDWRGNVPLEEQMLDYDVAIRNQTRGIERISPWHQADELVFPTNKQLKSTIGNNGMFDMTNPNIYKSVLPIGLGVTLQMQEYEQPPQYQQQGGVIQDNQGQYKYPGEVTKINSPNITMKNVPYPMIGISNTGEQKLMLPEMDYYFKGAKNVTEYPILTKQEKEFLKALKNE